MRGGLRSCQHISGTGSSAEVNIRRCHKMSAFSFGIFTILFLVIFRTVEGVTETGILMLVPAGGMYDPNHLWNADISTLVGVNDCPDDEALDVKDLALKGTFRSERMFNLSFYEDVKMTMHVYNDLGEELLATGDCPYTHQSYITCPFSGSHVSTGEHSVNDGFRLDSNNSTASTLLSIINPRHYLSDTLNGVEIIVSSDSTLKDMPDAGYFGCFTKPSGAATHTLSDINTMKCYEQCASTEFFALSETSCYCVAGSAGTPTGLTLKPEEDCTTLCAGDNAQFCGGTSSSSVYVTTGFQSFVQFYQGLNATTEIGSVFINSTSLQTFATTAFVSGAQVVEEEECQLTNLYFDVMPPTYNLMVSSSCSITPGSLHAVLDGKGEVETFSAIKSGCVILEPGDNNYTYPRATISILGPSGDVVSVGGMFVIRGTWTIPESSSSILSSTVESSMLESSSIDMSTSAEMSTMDSSPIDSSPMMSTTMDMSSSTPDIPATSSDNAAQTTINPTATASATAGATPGGGSTAGGTAGETASGTMSATPGATASMTTGATAGSTAGATASATTGATAGPTAGATASATTGATAGATSGATVPFGAGTTTPSPGVGGATTPGPVVFYSEDGRLIYEACTCRCKLPPPKPNQTPLEAAKERAEKVSEELHVDTKNLSATIRKKESATDERTSASAGGYAAIILLSFLGIAFILADALSIMTHISFLKSNVSSFFGKA